MSRAIRVYRRQNGSLSVTICFNALTRKIQKGTFTRQEREIYRRVFGIEALERTARTASPQSSTKPPEPAE
jgi:hypothetical protein